MNCSEVFTDYLVQCPESIKINSYLDPTTEYKWIITDKFGKEYAGYITTDADGKFEIPIDELPEGLLTSYSGEFELRVYATSGVYGQETCDHVHIPLAKNYESVRFEIKAGTNQKDNIGCDV